MRSVASTDVRFLLLPTLWDYDVINAPSILLHCGELGVARIMHSIQLVNVHAIEKVKPSKLESEANFQAIEPIKCSLAH